MIVHVMGLPGAGKSTLTEHLSARLDWPVLSIGTFRRGRSPDPVGEAEAWHAFYDALDEQDWAEVIVETSGFNWRIARLTEEVPADQLLRVKLGCDRQRLHERVRERDRERELEPWAYSSSIPDRHVFIDRFHDAVAELSCDLEVCTAEHSSEEVLELVVQALIVAREPGFLGSRSGEEG